jgi:hypothetical protein
MQAAVDPQVEEPAHDATSRHDQHAEQRHRRVHRAKAESGVQEDQQRTSDAENHVDDEPPLHLAQALHEAEVLPERVREKQQHHHAARHAHPVADVVARTVVAHAGKAPDANDEQRQQNIQRDVAEQAQLLLRGCGRGGDRFDRSGGQCRHGSGGSEEELIRVDELLQRLRNATSGIPEIAGLQGNFSHFVR